MNPNQDDIPNNFGDLSLDVYDPYNINYTQLLSQNQFSYYGGASQSVEMPSFSTQPQHVVESQEQTQSSGRGRGRGRAARGGGDADAAPKSTKCAWSKADDLLLISGYLNTTKDPVINTNQTSEAFWKRIQVYWNTYKKPGQGERTQKSVKQRWHTFNPFVNKFVCTYHRASNDKKSGENEDDVMKRAHELFKVETGKGFLYEHIWEALRNEPKWSYSYLQQAGGMNQSSGSAPSSKRSSTDMEGSNQETPTSGFTGTFERPEGIKKAKRKGKKFASTSCAEDDGEDTLEREKILIQHNFHELKMTKEARKRDKQVLYLQIKTMEMDMEQKRQEMEREQKRQEMEKSRKWEMLCMLMNKSCTPEEEVYKMQLMKEFTS